MRILFYLEPVTFRNDPLWLSAHVNNVRCFINANLRDDVAYGFASSPWLCRDYDRWLVHGGSSDLARFEISPRAITEAFGFDRAAYSADLFNADCAANPALYDHLVAIREAFDPDVVLCCTQNSYLQHVFADRLVLFYETGPLPRWDGCVNYYFDTGGHQRGSILETAAADIKALPLPDRDLETALARWEVNRDSGPDFPAVRADFQAWLEPIAAGRPVALIASQPADWLAVEGAYRNIPPGTATMEILATLPKDRIAVPTYHRDAPRRESMEQALAEMFPNLAPLPERFDRAGSDPLIPAIDGLVTITSKAGLSALVSGKPVSALGQSMLAGFAERGAGDLARGSGLDDATRARLLCFIANRYSVTFEQCFQINGYLLGFFETLLHAASPRAAQLNLSDWSKAKLDAILGPA
jgi:hypothetical protein